MSHSPIKIKSINGWVPHSLESCLPKKITQVKSKTNSVGDLIITAILSEKMTFTLNFKYIKESDVERITKEFKNFNALVKYEDFEDGKIKEGRFYPGDRQPVPTYMYDNGELIYETYPLTIIEK